MASYLSYTSASTAARCLREYWHRYIMGLRPRRTDALRFGAAYHLFLEIAYTRGADAAVEAVRDAYDAVPDYVAADCERLAEWCYERETVIALGLGHLQYWRQEPVHGLATEVEFDMPIVNPLTGRQSRRYSYKGKIDRIVRLPDGRLAVQEYKTTSGDISALSPYWTRLRIDPQISGYFVAAKNLGYDVATVLYDVTRKPSIRPTQVPVCDDEGVPIIIDTAGRQRVVGPDGRPARRAGQGQIAMQRRMTPDEWRDKLSLDIAARPHWYYARQEIPRLESDIEQWRIDLWHYAAIIGACAAQKRYPRNADACFRFNAHCPYLTMCANGWKPGDPVPEHIEQEDKTDE